MIWMLLILLTPADGHAQTVLGTLTVCADTLDLSALFDRTLHPQNQYTLTYLGDREILGNSQMILSFDSEVSLKLIAPRTARISKSADNPNQFVVTFTDRTSFLRVQVLGPASGLSIPYVLSVVLNDVELCIEPKTGYLVYATEKPKPRAAETIDYATEKPNARAAETIVYATEKPKARAAETILIDEDKVEELIAEINASLDESCGKRKVVHTELIVHGQPTQPGEWPWHAAILKFDGSSLRFSCGGTLLSKTLVLTAAHCATVGNSAVVPYSLSVVLGKYNLIGGDIAAQEKGVFEVIVHSAFDVKTLNNDIALLRLKSEAVFDDYVQPACLWHSALPTDEVFGKVVGWGFNHQDKLSLTLQQITVPIISELTCLKSDPLFFHRKLNTNKFCAGFANGTSVCNGDSGGGLMIFVPDTAGDTGKPSGAWYVRGIVSLAARRSDAAICDPYLYTIFTDVEKYRDWVMNNWN